MANQISFALAYWERRIDVCEARTHANPTSAEPLRVYADELQEFVSHLASVETYSGADLELLGQIRHAILEARWLVAHWGQPIRRTRRH